MDEFKQWCKQNKLKKQAPGKELWGIDSEGGDYKEYYIQNDDYLIMFEITPAGVSKLFFT